MLKCTSNTWKVKAILEQKEKVLNKSKGLKGHITEMEVLVDAEFVDGHDESFSTAVGDKILHL